MLDYFDKKRRKRLMFAVEIREKALCEAKKDLLQLLAQLI
jgi:hypothetical protein